MNRRSMLSLFGALPFIGGMLVSKAIAATVVPQPFSDKYTTASMKLKQARDLALPGMRGLVCSCDVVSEGDILIDWKDRCLVILAWNSVKQRSAIRTIPEAHIADDSYKARFRPLFNEIRAELEGKAA